MDRDEPDSRERALRLHRAGQLRRALVAYEALLADAPGDADLLGLVGVLALQDERIGDAEALLGQSLASGGEARIYLRNLNNYLVLLKDTGREEDARTLAAGDLPEWPEGVVPDAAGRRTVLSLVEALLVLGQPAKARSLLDRALPQRSGDAAALNLDGRLCLGEGDADRAVEILSRAVILAPDDCQPLIALGYAQDRVGRRDACRETADRLARGWAVCSAPPKRSQRAAIMVLNPAPKSIGTLFRSLSGLHFSSNYAAEIAAKMRDEYRFISLFADLPTVELPEQLPPADVVLNNIVNSEPLNVPGRLGNICAVLDRIGRPVINHPDQVFQTTRQKNAILLEGIPNLKVPRIERYRGDAASAGEIAASIRQHFDFPVIIRQASAHESSQSLFAEDDKKVAVLLPDHAALSAHLERRGWREFYAVEFVDLKRNDGFYRKLRAVFINGRTVIDMAAINPQWMVSGWRARPRGIDFYRANPQTIEECNGIVSDPEGQLGGEVMQTLGAIRDRIPLDMFGVDFDVDREGQVVFFEASAAMIFHAHNQETPFDLRLPAEVFERVDDAFRNLVAQRIAGAGVTTGLQG